MQEESLTLPVLSDVEDKASALVVNIVREGHAAKGWTYKDWYAARHKDLAGPPC